MNYWIDQVLCPMLRLGCTFTSFQKHVLIGPGEYDILGFTDIMMENIKRHGPAILNPKLGFLSSAVARPPQKDKGDINIVSQSSCHCLCEKPRKWRNMRPRPAQTYTFNGGPPKFPVSLTSNLGRIRIFL